MYPERREGEKERERERERERDERQGESVGLRKREGKRMSGMECE